MSAVIYKSSNLYLMSTKYTSTVHHLPDCVTTRALKRIFPQLVRSEQKQYFYVPSFRFNPKINVPEPVRTKK